MSLLNLSISDDMVTGGEMLAEHLTVPMAELEGLFQGGVDQANFAAENTHPHSQALRGRNFRSRAVTDVFRHREDEPWNYAWNHVSSDWLIGTGQWCDIPGCSIRFFAREEIASAMVFASFEYRSYESSGRGNIESSWDQDPRIDGFRSAQVLSHRGGGYSALSAKVEVRSRQIAYGMNFRGVDHFKSQRKRGWHEVITTITEGEGGHDGSALSIERANISVVLVYR